jgi:hypothetical protein
LAGLVDGDCLTIVDGSLGGGLLALVLSTLVTLAELDFDAASLDFWQSWNQHGGHNGGEVWA